MGAAIAIGVGGAILVIASQGDGGKKQRPPDTGSTSAGPPKPDTGPPSPPIDLLGSTRGTEVILTWTKSTSADVDHYSVFRNDKLIGQSTTNSFRDRSAEAGLLLYRVAAIDRSGNASPSAATRVKIVEPPPPGPCSSVKPPRLTGDGPFEPNEDQTQARLLTDGREHGARLESYDDKDWFVFCTGPDPRLLEVTLRFPGDAYCTLYADLLGSKGEDDQIDEIHVNSGSNDVIKHQVAARSLYYVEVAAYDACASNEGPFKYRIQVGPADALRG